MLLKHYDVNGIVAHCLEIIKPDVKKLKEFEESADLDRLPDDRSIKCYMQCLLVEFELMTPNVAAFEFVKFLGAMDEMEPVEQNIYMKMFKKCNRKYKDPCEMAYQAFVCMKRNDNEHAYMFYDTDFK